MRLAVVEVLLDSGVKRRNVCTLAGVNRSTIRQELFVEINGKTNWCVFVADVSNRADGQPMPFIYLKVLGKVQGVVGCRNCGTINIARANENVRVAAFIFIYIWAIACNCKLVDIGIQVLEFIIR